MSEKLNQNELNTLIAKEIKEKGLNNVLKIDAIKERVQKKIQEMGGINETEVVNELENPGVANGVTKFPHENEDEDISNVASAQEEPVEPTIPTSAPIQNKEAGDAPLNTPIEPKIATREIPDFLKNVEPGKVIVFDYNELSEGGENLTNKPLRTFENPDVRKSISQMWSEEGKMSAEVYQAKFEKIGNLEYDYKNGITNFVPTTDQPEINTDGTYKENPYKVEPNPIIEKDVEQWITQNVDMDKKVNDVISNIVKNYFTTNSERAVNDTINQEKQPIQQQPTNIAESSLEIKDLVGDKSGFVKTDTPIKLIESIEIGDAKYLSKSNNEVKEYVVEGKKYFILATPVSLKKCYIKK